MGALPAWAFSTMRMMRASVLSSLRAVVSTSSMPSWLIAPPVTRLPGVLCTGRLSPVSIDLSCWLDAAVDRHLFARQG